MEMSRRKRLLLVLVMVVVFSLAFLQLFGFRTYALLQARSIARVSPIVKQVPVRLEDNSVSANQGTKISCVGYEFEVPWDDLAEIEQKDASPNFAVLKFSSGRAIVVKSGSAAEDFVTGAGSHQAGLIQLLGSEAIRSGFDFKRSILETTPEQITLFTPKQIASSKLMLLTIKANIAPAGSHVGMFQISSKNFKGFQFGKPGASERSLYVELYSEYGSLNFVFGQLKDAHSISQADINRIVQTLRKIPPPAANTVSSKHTG